MRAVGGEVGVAAPAVALQPLPLMLPLDLGKHLKTMQISAAIIVHCAAMQGMKR